MGDWHAEHFDSFPNYSRRAVKLLELGHYKGASVSVASAHPSALGLYWPVFLPPSPVSELEPSRSRACFHTTTTKTSQGRPRYGFAPRLGDKSSCVDPHRMANLPPIAQWGAAHQRLFQALVRVTAKKNSQIMRFACLSRNGISPHCM